MENRIIIIVLIFIIVCQLSCNNNIQEKDKYIIEEVNIGKDCSIYKIIFENHSYIFKYALSGACNELKVEDYINEYEKFYSSNDTLKLKSGKILFEYYDNFGKIDYLKDSIINVTRKISKKNVIFHSQDLNSIIIEVE